MYATFDLGLIGYWAVPTAPPWYAAQQGSDGRRADARAAAHDGRVRRGVLGVRLGAAVRCPGRQPLGRHALAALRHVRHGRPSAGRDRTGGRRARLGATPARSASRSCTSASTTSSTSRPASRWPRASAARAPRGDAAAASASPPACRRWRRGRAHERRDRATSESAPRRPPGEPGRRARTSTTSARRSRSPGATSSRSAGFLLASVAALYFLLPQLAGLDDTWNRIEDGRPAWIARGAAVHVRHVRRLRRDCSAACSCAPARASAGRASYQITMAGLAASRLFAAGGAGGLVLTAWALRRAGMRKRTVADKTISFLVAHLPALLRGGRGLRLRPALGALLRRGPVLADVRARRRSRVVLLALALAVAFVPTDLQRRMLPFAREEGRRRAARPSSSRRSPRRRSAGMRDALDHLRSRDPALLGAVLFWGVPDRGAVGRVPRVRRRAAARGARAGVLRRDARQPAADARAASAGWRAA